ncbi:Scr1 family TA system antitoxin-like transcriptional regulator [Streptomyces sp. ISL-98]|uniref:Scr1 family TA system antitoxin-like transcriptional regulator n=1 Tax=Streptomyces sp. ISL-98 TaxID=2819192 RepID=UPI0027E5960B|nr:Scr1 family TA system antitoxin-like transcriptional regulator [Streptomyces sp. ISL-98]
MGLRARPCRTWRPPIRRPPCFWFCTWEPALAHLLRNCGQTHFGDPHHRQLAAGHRPVQDTLTVEYEQSTMLLDWENTMVVGMLQTPDYARSVFQPYADLHQSVRDSDNPVRSPACAAKTCCASPAAHSTSSCERPYSTPASARHRSLPPSSTAGRRQRPGHSARLGIVPFGAPKVSGGAHVHDLPAPSSGNAKAAPAYGRDGFFAVRSGCPHPLNTGSRPGA